MNKTLEKMMKPMPAVTDKTAVKAEQEAAVIGVLNASDYSMRSRDIAENFKNTPFPGVNEGGNPAWYDRRTLLTMKTRAISAALKRLEGKGTIVSAIYHGSRYYSIPVEG